MSDNKNEKPAHFKVLKILGFGALILGIILIILSVTVFGDPFMGTVTPNFALLAPGMFLIVGSFALILWGFAPEIAKIQTKGARYIQQENKEDFTNIADTTADIARGAVTKTVRAVKEGLRDYKYCHRCGKEIDADAAYCKHCGAKQD